MAGAREDIPLPRDFYLQDTTTVARDLLGRHLVLQRPGAPDRVARIVETEAYLGEGDRASHAWHGHTKRTAPMYEDPGHAYLYFVYGMHWCLNAVTEPAGSPCAVLLRAVEPLAGLMRATNGPARLCKAFGIDGAWNRTDLTTSDLRITTGQTIRPERIGVSPRIGIPYAGEWASQPLRFFITDNQWVSGARAARSPRLQPAPERAPVGH